MSSKPGDLPGDEHHQTLVSKAAVDSFKHEEYSRAVHPQSQDLARNATGATSGTQSGLINDHQNDFLQQQIVLQHQQLLQQQQQQQQQQVYSLLLA